MNLEYPHDWKKYSISKFIEDASNNTLSTFVNLRKQFDLLEDVNLLYERISKNLDHTKNYFSAFFLLRSHASYLGAVRLVISGQLPETYILLRGCLENALYGHYFYQHPESEEVWLKRHDSEATRDKVKKEFRIGALLDCLNVADSATHVSAKALYETTIDWGAHPNERALHQSLSYEKKESNVQFHLSYLSDISATYILCMQVTALSGLCSLRIFRNVFKERYDKLGVTDQLGQVQRKIFNLPKNST